VSLFRGPNHMYGVREFSIETTPADGYVDLFYVRSGFQKRFEQAESPVRVIIPSRLEAGRRDSLTVRVFADGYQPTRVTFDINGKVEDLAIDLEPLPNSLEAVDYRYFAGRATISFMTREALSFRIQDSETGYAVILNETSISPEARSIVEAIRGPRIAEAYAQQLGADLVVRLMLREDAESAGLELRSRQSYDAPRALHVFEIDLVAEDVKAASVQRALATLAQVTASDVNGCAGVFDTTLRGQLDLGELSRALRPRGAFSDRYLRAGMRRLGEISVDRVVDFEDGTRLRLESPLEIEMAILNASTARGYLALLRSFVNRNETSPLSRQQALRSLVAPQLSASAFQKEISVAEAAEAKCRLGGGSGSGSVGSL
ncbi:MAG: hypothetical protein VCC04_01665, partial [Myxococcota bacterium]